MIREDGVASEKVNEDLLVETLWCQTFLLKPTQSLELQQRDQRESRIKAIDRGRYFIWLFMTLLILIEKNTGARFFLRPALANEFNGCIPDF